MEALGDFEVKIERGRLVRGNRNLLGKEIDHRGGLLGRLRLQIAKRGLRRQAQGKRKRKCGKQPHLIPFSNRFADIAFQIALGGEAEAGRDYRTVLVDEVRSRVNVRIAVCLGD